MLSQRDRDSSLTYKTLPNQCASLEKEEELCTCCNGDPHPDRGSVETTFFDYQVCKGFSVVHNLDEHWEVVTLKSTIFKKPLEDNFTRMPQLLMKRVIFFLSKKSPLFTNMLSFQENLHLLI